MDRNKNNNLLQKTAQKTYSLGFISQILNCIQEPSFIKDAQHRWLLVNDKCCQFLGLKPEEIIGKLEAEFLSNIESRTFWEKDEQVLNTSITQEYEAFLSNALGEKCFVSINTSLLVDELGNKFLLTQIKEQPIQIADQKLLQLLIDNIPQAIFLKDHNFRYLCCSRKFAQALGLNSPEEIIGKTDYDFNYKKEEADWFQECDCRVMATATAENNIIEKSLQPNGEIRWMKTSKTPLCDRHGTVMGILGYVENITESKQAELELQQLNQELEKRVEERTAELKKEISERITIENQLRTSQQILKLVIDNIPQFIFWKDSNLVYLGCNQNFAEQAGLESPEEIIGCTDYDLPWKKEKSDWYRESDQKVIKSGVAQLHIIETKHRSNGQQYWVDTNKIPLHDPDGNVIGILGTYEDITERKRAESILKQTKAELELRVEQRTRELVEANTALEREIQEKIQAETELRTSEQRLASLIQQMPFAVIQWNQAREVEEWNTAAERIFGYTREEAIGSKFEFIVPQNLHTLVDTVIANIFQGKTIQCSTNENITKDKKVITCEWYSFPLTVENGTVTKFGSIIMSVTERQQFEQNLMLYKQALESSGDAIIIADAEGNHIYQNPAFCKLFDCENVEKFVEIGGLLATFTNLEIAQQIQQHILSGQSWAGDVEQCSLNGQIMQTYLRTSAIKDSQGESIGCVSTITDITDIKSKEIQLREQEQFLRSIYDGVEHLIFVLNVSEDKKTKFAGWNLSTEKAIGITSAQILNRTPIEIFGEIGGEAMIQRHHSCIALGRSITYEEQFEIQGKNTFWVTTLNPLKNSEGRIYRLVGTTFNITERKEAEIQLKQQTEDLETALKELQQTQTQLIQSEKMSSLGQLVAGVAHEINNPVNFIFGNINHASEYIHDLVKIIKLYQEYHSGVTPEIIELEEEIDLEFLIVDLMKLLNSMKVGAQRIREIVVSLRTFSRMDEAEMKEVNIHQGIDSTLMILEHRLKATSDRCAIAVIKEYGDLPLVECYAGQLNQVFMNIIANSIDALEESLLKGKNTRKPEIYISTQLTKLNQVIIRIADNGLGITEDVRKRLFDPFFTTKPIGKGTGMGLSISYQIITQKHHGSIECLSELDKGAEFIITIPLYQNTNQIEKL